MPWSFPRGPPAILFGRVPSAIIDLHASRRSYNTDDADCGMRAYADTAFASIRVKEDGWFGDLAMRWGISR
jgi:hypothetical protein